MTMYSITTDKPKAKKQPTRQARQRVHDAFDPEALADLCTTWDFGGYAERVDLPDDMGRKRFYYYQDNGSDILAVAHLDSVQENGECTITDTTGGLLVTSGTLDDRLGVYVILELLPALGVNCDWLLTTDEEIGQSTADEFFPEKRYNWMFQFDRGGTDVVMYDYETDELCELITACGARVGNGSFSDICMLEHLGCAGFNWGVGYQDYHGPRSHAWLDDTFRMVARFVKFYNANADKVLTHVPMEYGHPFDSTSGEEFWLDCGHCVDLNDPHTYDDDGFVNCRCLPLDGLDWGSESE